MAWPVDPRYSDDAANRYAAALGQRPAATIVDRERLAWRLDQGSAGRKSRSEVPLLARASALSAAAGQAMVAETAGAARQLFLAHSLTLLQESPGLARTVLVAPDRGLDADPTALNELLTFARSVPWLSSTTVSTLIDQAAGADAVTTAASGDEAPIPVSPLSPAVRTHLTELGAEAGEVGDIRSDGASIQADVTARIAALTSSAWRGHEEAFGVVMQGLTQEITANRNAVRVADQTINFLADSGRVQITVVNSLDVPVRGVRVQLVPQRPILRIAQDTKVVDIGANSRTTVTYAVDALAAGNVRLEARVTGPTGRAVGPTTSMLVRATPTGAGIYWVLGGVILVVFALGLWRNRRQRRRAAATGATTPNVVQVDDDGDVIEQARIARDHEPEVDRADTVEERA